MFDLFESRAVLERHNYEGVLAKDFDGLFMDGSVGSEYGRIELIGMATALFTSSGYTVLWRALAVKAFDETLLTHLSSQCWTSLTP